MFGSQCRNVDNSEDIDDKHLAVMANNNLATVKKPRVLVMRTAGGDVGGDNDDTDGGIVESEDDGDDKTIND